MVCGMMYNAQYTTKILYKETHKCITSVVDLQSSEFDGTNLNVHWFFVWKMEVIVFSEEAAGNDYW